jgi:hypothetical protein
LPSELRNVQRRRVAIGVDYLPDENRPRIDLSNVLRCGFTRTSISQSI